MIDFEKEIIKDIHKITGKVSLEIPPDPKMGDYALPCFDFAKKYKKSPNEIAKELAKKIKPNKYISKVKNIGPYVNFFVNKELLAENILNEINLKKDKFGCEQKKKYTIMIESPGPNTNKPLHLGHVRNMVLGNSLINISKFLGYKAVRVDILNNRGVHICKSMLAYDKYGKNQKPNKKSDHYVGDFYVKYAEELPNHPEFENEIQEMLKKWEDGDKKTRKLWKKMNKWALDGIFETYKRYGVKMDKAYAESDHYMKGRKIVEDGLKQKVFERDDKGNIFINLEKIKLGKKILLRADGTSVYITQDLALAKLRYDDYKMDKMIYIVGSEQIYHFKVLFKLFETLKYPYAKNCYHLAYGMIYLPEGKMKSREGTVVDADTLADKMHEAAKKEIEKRYKLNKKEIEKRAEAIAMAAIKFFILKFDPMKDFVFNPKESLSFEGETGPYVQYTHARASSIIRKYRKNNSKLNLSLLNTELDRLLLKSLYDFPSNLEKAAQDYKPSLLTRYLLDLSQLFNEYYHKHQILQENKELEKTRILLVKSIKQVLKTGLNLLGIDALDVM